MTAVVINLSVGQDRTRAGWGLPKSFALWMSGMLILLRTGQWESRGEWCLWEWLAANSRGNHQNIPNKGPAWAPMGSNKFETDTLNSSVAPLHSPLFPRHYKDHMHQLPAATTLPDPASANSHNLLLLGPTLWCYELKESSNWINKHSLYTERNSMVLLWFSLSESECPALPFKAMCQHLRSCVFMKYTIVSVRKHPLTSISYVHF